LKNTCSNETGSSEWGMKNGRRKKLIAKRRLYKELFGMVIIKDVYCRKTGKK
jgi:hypothetical protein